MQNLMEHAKTIYGHAISFLHYILDDFPGDKINSNIGQANAPLQIMNHLAGTAVAWMRNSGKEFDNSGRCTSIDEFFEVLNGQHEIFNEYLKDESEIYWKSNTQDKARLSVPWIMIRTANHLMHHASMLIVYRHYYGLPPLQQTREINWGRIVDLPGQINYSQFD